MADRVPRFEEGPVYVDDFIDLADAVRANRPTGGPGIKVSRTPSGSIVEAIGGTNRPFMYRVEIPAGGIANNASAACLYYGSAHTLTASTITAYNRTGVSVGGVSAKIGYAAWIEVEAEYQIIQEVC